MCRAGCSLDIDGDQEVAVTGARGRRMTRLIIMRQRQSRSLLSTTTKHQASSFLTDDGLAMMTGHVMEHDTVSVEVVENRQADLVTLSVVRLGPTKSGMTCSFDIHP